MTTRPKLASMKIKGQWSHGPLPLGKQAEDLHINGGWDMKHGNLPQNLPGMAQSFKDLKFAASNDDQAGDPCDYSERLSELGEGYSSEDLEGEKELQDESGSSYVVTDLGPGYSSDGLPEYHNVAVAIPTVINNFGPGYDSDQVETANFYTEMGIKELGLENTVVRERPAMQPNVKRRTQNAMKEDARKDQKQEFEAWEVITKRLYVREHPHPMSKIVATLSMGDKMLGVKRGGLRKRWIKTALGWCCSTDDSANFKLKGWSDQKEKDIRRARSLLRSVKDKDAKLKGKASMASLQNNSSAHLLASARKALENTQKFCGIGPLMMAIRFALDVGVPIPELQGNSRSLQQQLVRLEGELRGIQNALNALEKNPKQYMRRVVIELTQQLILKQTLLKMNTRNDFNLKWNDILSKFGKKQKKGLRKFRNGETAWYKGCQRVVILKAHFDDLDEPYYTIKLFDGSERQTLPSYLKPIDDDTAPEEKQKKIDPVEHLKGSYVPDKHGKGNYYINGNNDNDSEHSSSSSDDDDDDDSVGKKGCNHANKRFYNVVSLTLDSKACHDHNRCELEKLHTKCGEQKHLKQTESKLYRCEHCQAWLCEACVMTRTLFKTMFTKYDVSTNWTEEKFASLASAIAMEKWKEKGVTNERYWKNASHISLRDSDLQYALKVMKKQAGFIDWPTGTSYSGKIASTSKTSRDRNERDHHAGVGSKNQTCYDDLKAIFDVEFGHCRIKTGLHIALPVALPSSVKPLLYQPPSKSSAQKHLAEMTLYPVTFIVNETKEGVFEEFDATPWVGPWLIVRLDGDKLASCRPFGELMTTVNGKRKLTYRMAVHLPANPKSDNVHIQLRRFDKSIYAHCFMPISEIKEGNKESISKIKEDNKEPIYYDLSNGNVKACKISLDRRPPLRQIKVEAKIGHQFRSYDLSYYWREMAFVFERRETKKVVFKFTAYDTTKCIDTEGRHIVNQFKCKLDEGELLVVTKEIAVVIRFEPRMRTTLQWIELLKGAASIGRLYNK